MQSFVLHKRPEVHLAAVFKNLKFNVYPLPVGCSGILTADLCPLPFSIKVYDI
jgi:hypothetical protein